MAVRVSKLILAYTLILGIKATETDITGSPRNLTASCVNDSSVFLIWYRPNLPDGAIKNYSVSYYLMKEESDDDNGGSTIVNIDVGNETTSSVDIDELMPNTEYHITVTAYTSVGPGGVANLSVTTASTEKGAVVDDQCNHNEQCNNSGALAVLCTLIVILLVGLTISVVMNMWLCFKDGRSVETNPEEERFNKFKKATAGYLHEIRNPLFQMLKVKTTQRSDAPSNNTVKMDNNQQEVKAPDEPFYDDIVEISKNQKSSENTNNTRMASFDVAKVDDNLQKVKELPELAYNTTQLTNQKIM